MIATVGLECPEGMATVSWSQTHEAIRRVLESAITLATSKHRLCEVDLELRALLHLPQFTESRLFCSEFLESEVGKLATQLSDIQADYRLWAERAAAGELHKIDWSVLEADEGLARIIHERFHYIGAFRPGRHFALYCRGLKIPAALATVSDMDIKSLKALLPKSAQENSRVLSRVFAFRWAPQNSISFLLGAITRLLRKESETNSIVTWINPNLGFRGVSYRASNWELLGFQQVRYRYVEGKYLTARQIFERQDTNDVKIHTAPYVLAPLQGWCYRLGI